MALYGYDESHYQTTLIGPDFVILKATQGVTTVDPTCDTKYQANKAAGKLVGVYHYANFGDPIAEANYFVANIQGYLGEAIVALDIETNTNVGWAKSFLDRVYELTKVRAMIYMSASTSNAANWSAISSDYALWVAGYPAKFNVANPPTPVPSGSDMPYATGAWKIATIWQYSSSAGTLDRDIAYMTADAWHKFAIGDRNVKPPEAPVPTPPPVPEPTPTPPPEPTPPSPVEPTPVPPTPVPEPTPGVPTPPTPVPSPKPAPKPAPKKVNWLLRFLRWLRDL